MGKRLVDEIARLPETIRAASRIDVERLADQLVRRPAGRPAVFVGSGGAVAAARFAAQLYSARVGAVASVQTPLEVLAQPLAVDCAGFLFTASGRHPDATAAVRRLSLDATPAVVVTTNPAPAFGSLCERLGVELVDLGNPAGKDGFLATNSLIMMAVAVARALTDMTVPSVFPALAEPQALGSLDEVVVLYPPGLVAVAVDLEARLSETGLAAVQIADYRNFAHGRHYGLASRAADVTVLALIDEPYRHLAERTLSLLPRSVPLLRMESPLQPPWDTIDLLLASILLVAAAGASTGLDAGRPLVPEFGRRLYRLPIGRGSATALRIAPPVKLKLRELGLPPRCKRVADEYEAAFAAWRRRLRGTTFVAIVLDYDGTVVSTEGRYELPGQPMRRELERLLQAGATLGFASGRGDSLQQDLRRWLPKRYWRRVQLGLYNGAVEIRLDEELPERIPADPALAEAAERIAALPLGQDLELVDRHYQLQITPTHGSGLSVPALARMVTGALRRPPELPLEAVGSAHSIDILPRASTKVRLLECVQSVGCGPALAIGDQGQLGGNDFALLAAQALTLSVDRCSGDPTRCWRLVATATGPTVLLRYLAALETTGGGLRFRWSAR
jgi:hypothetical protein